MQKEILSLRDRLSRVFRGVGSDMYLSFWNTVQTFWTPRQDSEWSELRSRPAEIWWPHFLAASGSIWRFSWQHQLHFYFPPTYRISYFPLLKHSSNAGQSSYKISDITNGVFLEH